MSINAKTVLHEALLRSNMERTAAGQRVVDQLSRQVEQVTEVIIDAVNEELSDIQKQINEK